MFFMVICVCKSTVKSSRNTNKLKGGVEKGYKMIPCTLA